VDTARSTQQALPLAVAEARLEREELNSAQTAGQMTVLAAFRPSDTQVPSLAPQLAELLSPTPITAPQSKDINLFAAWPSPQAAAAQVSPHKFEP
jgi:hypothetical protein